MVVDQDRLHHLKQDAKWASSIENQIKAVKELGSLGEVALPSLEEVMQISARDEIKQCCIEAIRELGKNSRSKGLPEKQRTSKTKKVRQKRGSSAR